MVLLDDATDQTDPGPVCVDSQATDIDPAAGAVVLSYRVNFGMAGPDRDPGVGMRLSPACNGSHWAACGPLVRRRGRRIAP